MDFRCLLTRNLPQVQMQAVLDRLDLGHLLEQQGRPAVGYEALPDLRGALADSRTAGIT
jgi:hypothetical protein